MAKHREGYATLASVVQLGVDNRLKDLHTAMPGIIRQYDPELQTATVQPAIKRIVSIEEEFEEVLTPIDIAPLINVPIIFQRGGGFSITFPIAVGDECLLLFCERSIDNWHQSGGSSLPGAKRFHSLSDATAIVGLSSLPNKVPDFDRENLTIKKDDGTCHLKIREDSTLEIETASDVTIDATGDVVATCANITVDASSTAVVTCPESTFNGNVTVNGNITFTGEVSGPNATITSSVVAGGKELVNHSHAGSPSSPNGPVTPTGVNQ